jgi:hypothetical protein
MLVDRRGIPLAAGLSAANTHDSMLLEPMVDAVPPGQGPARAAWAAAQAPGRAALRQGVRLPALPSGAAPARHHAQDPRRGIEPSQRLGRHRYVVERSLAWLVGYRRPQIRYERRADVLLGFLHLACALICLNSLNRTHRPARCRSVP